MPPSRVRLFVQRFICWARRDHRACLARGIVLLIATFFVPPVAGQVIELDPPQEIEVDESRLIVTFEDSVSLQMAQEIAVAAGGEIAEVLFRPVTLWALFHTPPSPDPLLALRADERAGQVSVLPPAAAVGVWVTRSDGSRVMADFNTHALRVSFEPGTPAEEARAIVQSHFPQLDVRVERAPNELVVRLPEESEAVVSTIEGDPRVRYVTYFSVDQPASEE